MIVITPGETALSFIEIYTSDQKEGQQRKEAKEIWFQQWDRLSKCGALATTGLVVLDCLGGWWPLNACVTCADIGDTELYSVNIHVTHAAFPVVESSRSLLTGNLASWWQSGLCSLYTSHMSSFLLALSVGRYGWTDIAKVLCTMCTIFKNNSPFTVPITWPGWDPGLM